MISMMKLDIKSEYNKISILTKMEMKRTLNQISNVILLALIAIIFVNMFIFLSQSNDIKIQSNIALAIEDDSFELKTFLKNITDNKLKGIVNFQRSSLNEGLELLESNEVIALIHVDKETTDRLNNGKPASLDLYINDSSNITVKFLVGYLDNLIEVLNNGQNGAMIYWNIMKDEGFGFEDRLKDLNKIAINYMSAFLIRGEVFENSNDLDKFHGASLVDYYFTTALLIVSIISAVLFHLDISDDFKKGKIRRVLYSDFNLWHIYSSKIIVGVAFTSIISTIFKAIFMSLFSTFAIGGLLKFIIYVTFINIIIHMLVIVLYILIDNDIIRDWGFVLIFLVISFAGGIILPLDSMDKIFKNLSRLNILSIGHKLLSGYSITTERTIIIILYFIILAASIGYIHRKRSA